MLHVRANSATLLFLHKPWATSTNGSGCVSMASYWWTIKFQFNTFWILVFLQIHFPLIIESIKPLWFFLLSHNSGSDFTYYPNSVITLSKTLIATSPSLFLAWPLMFWWRMPVSMMLFCSLLQPFIFLVTEYQKWEAVTYEIYSRFLILKFMIFHNTVP